MARPRSFGWDQFQALPQVDDQQDFHCVTGWSILDLRFRGVRFETLAALARPLPEATHVMCHAADGYSTNLPLEEALKPDVLLVHALDGQPLPVDHGGPVRMVVPELYAWKGAKWINRLEFLTHDRRGYWEIRGYSNTGAPVARRPDVVRGATSSCSWRRRGRSRPARSAAALKSMVSGTSSTSSPSTHRPPQDSQVS